jgi:hypothetical protein
VSPGAGVPRRLVAVRRAADVTVVAARPHPRAAGKLE